MDTWAGRRGVLSLTSGMDRYYAAAVSRSRDSHTGSEREESVPNGRVILMKLIRDYEGSDCDMGKFVYLAGFARLSQPCLLVLHELENHLKSCPSNLLSKLDAMIDETPVS